MKAEVSDELAARARVHAALGEPARLAIVDALALGGAAATYGYARKPSPRSPPPTSNRWPGWCSCAPTTPPAPNWPPPCGPTTATSPSLPPVPTPQPGSTPAPHG